MATQHVLTTFLAGLFTCLPLTLLLLALAAQKLLDIGTSHVE